MIVTKERLGLRKKKRAWELVSLIQSGLTVDRDIEELVAIQSDCPHPKEGLRNTDKMPYSGDCGIDNPLPQ